MEDVFELLARSLGPIAAYRVVVLEPGRDGYARDFDALTTAVHYANDVAWEDARNEARVFDAQLAVVHRGRR